MNIDTLYVEILPYSEFLRLNEDNDILGNVVKQGKDYEDYNLARREICSILTEPCHRIEELDYIKYCKPNPSTDTTNPGLSVYMNLMFETPDGLTEEEINDNYKYSIRFSDHRDRHNNSNRKQIKLVGKSVENLPNTVWAIFNSELREFQEKIRDFEIAKFGEQKTFITDKNTSTKNESLKLRIAKELKLRIKDY